MHIAKNCGKLFFRDMNAHSYIIEAMHPRSMDDDPVLAYARIKRAHMHPCITYGYSAVIADCAVSFPLFERELALCGTLWRTGASSKG
jgi:hypothetical protein